VFSNVVSIRILKAFLRTHKEKN